MWQLTCGGRRLCHWSKCFSECAESSEVMTDLSIRPEKGCFLDREEEQWVLGDGSALLHTPKN